MIVIVIIGVLAAIGIPSYRNYVVRSKMAEAYQNLANLSKKQFTYYYENKEFYNIGPTQNPITLSSTMTIVSNSAWHDWYPAPVNSRVFFSYRMWAGKLDSSSADVGYSPTFGTQLTPSTADTYFKGSYASGNTPCNLQSYSPYTFGMVAQPNYDWAFLTAVADLNGIEGPACSTVASLIGAANGTPSSIGGFIVLNYGE